MLVAAVAGGLLAIYVFNPWEPSMPAMNEISLEVTAPDRASVPLLPKPPDTLPAFVSPTFDVVRISREGNAVIAGKAAPESKVTV